MGSCVHQERQRLILGELPGDFFGSIQAGKLGGANLVLVTHGDCVAGRVWAGRLSHRVRDEYSILA